MDKLTFEQYCNEPAFPVSESVSSWVNGKPLYKNPSGITRQEYFTAMAMQGMCFTYKAVIEPFSTIAQASVKQATDTLKVLYENDL